MKSVRGYIYCLYNSNSVN